MRPSLSSVLQLLDVGDAGGGKFVGAQPADDIERERVFGGQVVAQAMMAAARTVPGRRLHSVHVTFLRPGNPAAPLHYQVTTLREGRTFSTRRVSASQETSGGAVLMEALVSFIEDVDGDTYQQPMPAVTPPEALPAVEEQLAPYVDEGYGELVRLHIFEMRYIDVPPRVAVDSAPPTDAVCRLWMRVAGDVPDQLLTDPLLADCLLAYVSDWTILDPVQVGIGKTWQSLEVMASLDHTMWFHRPVDFSDWLLFDQRAGSAVGGRGLATAAIYNRDGTLVCTVAQEGFLGRRR
ncbi:MAG: thioesterase family protein [Mycobacterium sp.]|nr:thioesterase family protein [Mycobacterium sp.]